MKKLSTIFTLLLIVLISGCLKESDPELRKQIQLLIEKNKIIDRTNELFISTDNRDWQKVKSLFAPEVLFDMTSMTGGEPLTLTPQEIVDGWDKGLKALNAIHHQVGNYIINMSPEGAEVFCYGIASHYLPNKSGLNTRTFVGSYNFHLKKAGDSWLIDQFKFNLKYIDGNPDLEGSAR